jgi:hypothetical protein
MVGELEENTAKFAGGEVEGQSTRLSSVASV